MRITFTRNGKGATLCNFCESVWFAGKDIRLDNAGSLPAYEAGDNLEFTINEWLDKDQDHQPAAYPTYK